MKKKLKTILKDYSLVAVGSFLTALGLIIFLVPNKIASGGVSGLATVIHYLMGFPVGVVILVINIPLFLLSVHILGKHVGIRTLLGILVLSLSTDLLSPYIFPLTFDPFLATLYGGSLAGIGMGLVFRSGGTTGGTDLLAAIMHHYFPNFSIGQGLFLIDGLVVVLAGIVFNPELALYAAISILIQSKLIDLVQEGFNKSKAAIIISDYQEKIQNEIIEKMERGVTIFDGHGAYSGKKKNILMVTINRSELIRLKNLIYAIDSKAFVVLTEVHEVLGEGFTAFDNKGLA